MPLPSQILQFPFRYGLSEGTDPKQAPPGTLTRAQNVVWNKSRRIEKRPGTRALPVLDVSEGKRIFTRGTELCVIDGTNLSAFSSAKNGWKTVDKVPEVGLTWTALTDTATGVAQADVSLSSANLLTHAWVSGDPTVSVTTGTLFIQVTDHDTGTVLLTPTSIGSGFESVRVLTIGTQAFVIYKAGANIRARTVDLVSFAVSASTLIINDAANKHWDAIVIGSTFVVAYEHTGAAPALTLASFDTALAAVTTGSVTGSVGVNFLVGLAGALGEQIFIGYSIAAGDVHFATADPVTLAQIQAPVLVEAGGLFQQLSICRLDATRAVIAYTTSSTVPTRTSTAVVSNAGAVTAPRGTWYTTIGARPFVLNGRCYMSLCDSIPNVFITAFSGANVYLVEVETAAVTGEAVTTPHRYVGKIDTLIGARTHLLWPVPSTVIVSATEALFASPFLASATSTFTTWRTGLRLVSATIGASLPEDTWRTVSYDKDVFISGAVQHAYDGRSVFDYLFARAPVFLSSVIANPAGAIVLGDYLYATGLEYRSATGMLHRSPISAIPAPITVAGTPSQVTFGVFGTSIGSKQDLATGFATATARTVIIPAFRSVVNGAVLQRLTFEPSFNTLYNDPGVSTANLVDQRADASIDGAGTTLALRPAVYTAGGILDDRQAVASVTMFLHKSRMWQLAGDYKTWWFSKSFQDDIGTAPGFSASFRIVFDDLQTCGASMDEKAIFFSSSSIAYLQGEGPGPNGQNSDYGTPSRIQTDSGCTNPRSVISAPDGVMFQGIAGGIYILTRQLEVEWVGREVQEQLAAFPVITSAVLIAARNEIRFSCNDAVGATGIVLVYNYFEKQWSTFTYTAGAVTSSPIADACLWQGLYTFLTPVGGVFQEDATTFLDSGTTWVQMDVETAEIYAEGPLSYQLVRRAYLRGDLLSQCDVTLRVAIGGVASYDQTKVWKSAEMTAIGSAKMGVHVRRQKSDSIRFRMTDAPPSSLGLVVGTGQGVNLSAIGFDIAPIPGLPRRGAEARK